MLENCHLLLLTVGVLDPRTGKEVSIEEAVQLGLVNYPKGLYYDPVTGVSVSITQAIADGHMKVSILLN